MRAEGLRHRGQSSHPDPFSFLFPLSPEGCRSLGQLEFPLPEAGHPASPAHPFLGCPVPSVPPAAEPVPHLQTPSSEPQSVARACPQSAKPPSGSKSGLRTGPSCRHTVRSKATRRPSHPKQPRAQRPRPRRRRRRRTNGWVPVGAACEKAVYVLVSASSLLMGRGWLWGHEALTEESRFICNPGRNSPE